jgi:hypothetical protein
MQSRIARRAIALSGCVLLEAIPSAVGAQADLTLTPGARVRVSHADCCYASPQVGWLESVSADSVVLAAEMSAGRAVRLALPRGTVRSLEVGYRSGSHAWRGAGIGALVGAATGVTAVLIGVNCADDDEYCPGIKQGLVIAGAGVFALAGTMLGGVIGSSVRREKWLPVAVPAAVGLGPAYRSQLAVRLTLRL